jgi:predicted transposase YdaD
MTQASDIGSKRLISLAPQQWVNWVTQTNDIAVKEILNSEFQWVSRESDVLIRANSPRHGEFLILNELQLRYKPSMPKRMRAYIALAEEKYNLPIYPVLINIIKESDTKIPTTFKSKFMGLSARQDYKVINLWEIDAQIAFDGVSCLLPFVPILKNGGDEATIERALRVLRASEKLEQFEMLLGFFATFVLDSPLVQSIMRLDMAVLQQSPWYQQILFEGQQIGEEIGERRGQQIGEEIGEQRGEQRGIVSAIELGLELKFGAEALQLMESISQISDLDQLKVIKDAIKIVHTLDEIRQLVQH